MAPGTENDPRSGVHDNFVDCPDCNGEGTFNESECCGASIKWTDICEDCLEHCDESECETCGGAGEVTQKHYDDIKELEKQESEANQ